ncbi:hypothetical protein BGZ97_005626 [Linnemannia gamsii]|uniref:Uncharacterized protein n=1 Tax=Linnemannia gamsii TaxID=64522 RepID=A0A9P6QV40_9FUNG|nr:hypothetical protein BGZ97_005626 [Linnemannia gamsii]
MSEFFIPELMDLLALHLSNQDLVLKPSYHVQPYKITSEPPPVQIATIAKATTLVHHHSHNAHNPQLTSSDLLLDLFKQCPNVQSLEITGWDGNAAAYYFWKRIATAGFPDTIKELAIRITSCVLLCNSTILPMLFLRCSPQLRKLRISFEAGRKAQSYKPEYRVKDTREEMAKESLPALRDLTIISSTRGGSPESCGRFLSRCTNIESLTMEAICPMWSRALQYPPTTYYSTC